MSLTDTVSAADSPLARAAGVRECHRQQAIAVPSAAFADQIGQILGFSTRRHQPALSEPGHEAGRSTPRAPGARPDATARRAKRDRLLRDTQGRRRVLLRCRHHTRLHNIFKGVGCAPSDIFPSPTRPILGSPIGTNPTVPLLAGFAADGVARVDLVDANGATIASATVSDNIYAADVPPIPAAAIIAYDNNGQIIYQRALDGSPPATH